MVSDDETPPEGPQNQLGSITLKVSEHEDALKQLKKIPELLKKLTGTMPSDDMNDNQSHVSNSDNPFGLEFNQQTNNEGDSETDEVLAALQDIEKRNDYGPDLMKNVADGITKTVSRPLSKESLAKLSEKLLVPSNCKIAAVPKMNSEIWSNLPGRARIQDLQLQNFQQTNSQGLVALALIANQIAIRRNEIPENLAKEVLQVCMDGANVLGNGIQIINTKRRQEVRQYLNQEFVGICNTSIPVTENLFGDDLKEAMKASKTTSQVMRSGFGKTRGSRPHPYNKGFRQTYQQSQPSSSFSSSPLSLNRQRPPFNNQRRGGWKPQRQPNQFQAWKNNQRSYQ